MSGADRSGPYPGTLPVLLGQIDRQTHLLDLRELGLEPTHQQLIVYALVNAIYIPCVATIAMLARELGWRRAAVISLGTIAVAIAVGGVVAHALALL